MFEGHLLQRWEQIDIALRIHNLMLVLLRYLTRHGAMILLGHIVLYVGLLGVGDESWSQHLLLVGLHLEPARDEELAGMHSIGADDLGVDNLLADDCLDVILKLGVLV